MKVNESYRVKRRNFGGYFTMDMKSVESKWQAKWEKSKINVFNKKNVDKKWYVLEMFSYPSGAN